jgi:hypothetical protein
VKELEEKRINKEMANIRKKFKGWPIHAASHSESMNAIFRWKPGWISEEKVCHLSSCNCSSLIPLQDMSPRLFLRIFSVTKSISGTWKL